MTFSLLKGSEMRIGAMTFFAKQHKDDMCGSNGLPLTPNSIIIYGRAQKLKTIKNPYLCQYLDFIRGKHGEIQYSKLENYFNHYIFAERTVVVSQYCGKPLENFIEKTELDYETIKQIAFQVLVGLDELHKRNIVHRNLSTDNILLQNNEIDIKLFNYGLYYATDNGKLVPFPIL